MRLRDYFTGGELFTIFAIVAVVVGVICYFVHRADKNRQGPWW